MKWFFFISLLLVRSVAFAHGHASYNDSLLIGTWKGESICQVRSSPCHDEISVCHVSKGNKPDHFRFTMNKMVNGVEEDMGVIDFTYDISTSTCTSIDDVRNAIWTFKVKDNTMDGTLVSNNVLFRVIKLKKAN